MHEFLYKIFDQPDEQIPLLAMFAVVVVWGFWLIFMPPYSGEEPSHEYDRATGKVRRKR